MCERKAPVFLRGNFIKDFALPCTLGWWVAGGAYEVVGG